MEDGNLENVVIKRQIAVELGESWGIMIIRSEQFDAMVIPNIADFIERAIAFLYENFPESLDEDADELTETVGLLIEQAEKYGLETEQQVMTYITTAWLLGVNFDEEFPAANETLNSKDFTPDEKADWLAKWTEDIFAAFEEEEK